MLKKLKGKLKGKQNDDDTRSEGSAGLGQGHGSYMSLHRSSSMGTSTWGRRRSRRHRSVDPEEVLVRQKPTNPEGVMNPMNIFDYALVSSGWPKLVIPGCPVPHAVYAVSNRKPTSIEVIKPAPIRPATIVTPEVHEQWVSRLSEFYGVYAPDKVAEVQNLLETCYHQGMQPQALFESILEKYGKTESNWRPTDWRARLIKFYTIHDPDKLQNVPDILDYESRGGDLSVAWSDMLAKYGVTEDTWFILVDWRLRFTAFYYTHAKEKVPGVEQMLTRLADTNRDPAQLWRMMLNKYQRTEDNWWMRRDGEVDWHDRLSAFYSLHAPEKLVKIDEILDLVESKGVSPDSLWAKIMRQYGVSEDSWFHPPVPEVALPPPETRDFLVASQISMGTPRSTRSPRGANAGAAALAAANSPPGEQSPAGSLSAADRQVWGERFAQLFAVHSPENASVVPDLLNEGDLQGLWEALLETFEVTEQTWSDPPKKRSHWDRVKLAAKVGARFKHAGAEGGGGAAEVPPTPSSSGDPSRPTPRQRRRSTLQPLAHVGTPASPEGGAAFDASPTGTPGGGAVSPANRLAPVVSPSAGSMPPRSPRSPAPSRQQQLPHSPR